jgi:hypothetical protein
MDSREIRMDLSAQEADLISGALRWVPETKAKVDELLVAWAEGVLSDEQNAYVENLMSKQERNIPLIGPGKVRLALSEPAAALEHAISVSFSHEELELIKPKIEEHVGFINLMASRDRMHIIEDVVRDGLPEDDEEVQAELLNSDSRFEAKREIGHRVLQTINLHLQS